MTQPTPHEPLSSDRPEQAFAFLWQGRWWILAASLLVGLAGLAYAQQRGTLWRATSVILVERGGPVALSPDSSMEQLLPRNYAGTQAALLRSTPVLKSALDRPEIQDSPVFGGTGNPLAWLKKHLVVEVGNQDDLITLTLDSPLRAESCDVVNAVVDSYREFRAGSKRETASGVLEQLTGELDRYEAERQEQQQALVAFMKENPGVRLHADANVASERLRNLHKAMTEAELAAMDARATWQAAVRLAEMPELLRQIPIVEGGRTSIAPNPDAGASRQLQALRALRLQLMTEATADMTGRYRELQATRQKLLAELTPEHPAVREIDRDLALLREQATADDPTAELGRNITALEQQAQAGEAEFAAAYVAALEQRYESAVARQEDLAGEVAKQEQQILALEPKQAEYAMLETRLERASKIADLLYQRISEIDIIEELGNSGATATDSLVYEYATPEGAIVASSKRAVVAIATFLGFVLGVIIAWFRSLVDQRLRTAEDLAGMLPVLATAPRIDVHPDGILATWAAQDDYADAMRSLRMALSFGARGGASKVFQVASPDTDDGKTLVAAGLGIAMAQAGQRTLIIDADFHSPEQARLFGISEKTGMTQLLEHGRLDLSSLQSKIDKLYVLPAGPLPDKLDSLLGGPRLAATMKELAQRFDCIIIDSAPMLGGTEARVVAAVADETLLVVRSGRTTRKLVGISTASIVSVGGRVAGAVLNRVPRAGMLRATSRYSFGSRQAKDTDDMILVR
ncbi:MAG: GumC family protein [Planctomycetota bacterium]